MSTALVLFRQDFRLSDNAALTAACLAHERVLPVYIHAPSEYSPWQPGAASRWWLHHSLQALREQLATQGGDLHAVAGDPLDCLRDLIRASGATEIHWNRRCEPAAIAGDTILKAALREDGIAVHSHAGGLWSEPWTLATDAGQPNRVFTGAQELLEIFADDAVSDYAKGRDLPARHGTSRLSPHLHFGEVTPAQIQRTLQDRAARSGSRQRPDLEPYLRELGWREFAHHLLYHFPHTPDANFNPRFDAFRWAEPDALLLERWQRGRTGIPLVDAGMRELWHTGWMHNRVRMVVASFLTKNLRQHWRHGASWFWDTLVDADLANNTLGWQWVAGCGADAAPYFRVFNPYLQAARFDPDAAYLKRWLPELASLPAKALHEAWRHPAALAAKGCPTPMVDVGASRDAALAAWGALPA